MAELNTSGSSSRKGRTRIAPPKVDLTAMVDLAFLLITFFMLTTSLARSNAMQVSMPLNDLVPQPVALDRSVTLCIGPRKIYWYKGESGNPLAEGLLYDTELRNFLVERKKTARKNAGKGLFILVKPIDQSRYEDLVDVLDEIAISEINQYAIAELDSNERKLLRQKGL